LIRAFVCAKFSAEKFIVVMNQISLLRNFYALTEDGVWLVSTERYKGTVPIVELVEPLAGSKLVVGSRLEGGSSVAVTSNFLALYYQYRSDHLRTIHLLPLEDAADEDIGDRTARLIGCFLNQEEAVKACRDGRFQSALRLSYFERMTKRTLGQIGPNHPVFVVSRKGRLAFPADYYPEIGIDQNAFPSVPRESRNFGMEELTNPSVSEATPDDGEWGRGSGRERAADEVHGKPLSGMLDPSLAVVSIPVVNATPITLQSVVPRFVKIVVNGKSTEYCLPAGKHQVIEIRSPVAGIIENWWVLRGRFPMQIIGGAKSSWTLWLKTADQAVGM
jgi:hypothetical protein